jgi:hypothetical protein
MPVPRGLVTLAFLFVAAAFAATVGLNVPIQPTSTSYTPGVRAFLELLAVGGCAVWPVGRLALSPHGWRPARVLLDAVALAAIVQAVLWPLQLVTYWPPLRGMAIDALLVGWIAACGGAVACGMGRHGWRRAAWAIACIVLVAAGPAADALGATAPLPALLGPCSALLDVAPLRPGAPGTHDWPLVAWPWILACAAWAHALRATHPEPTGLARDPGMR